MHRSVSMRLALSVGLLVILVALVLSACSSGGGGEEQAKARPLPEEHQELRPGEYRTEEFKPSASFRVGEGWATSPPEDSDVLELEYGETAGLAFTTVQKVYKPTESGMPKVMEPPEDLVGWFQRHPYLKTSEPEPVTVGGVKGEQFDVVLKGLPEDYASHCGTDCVELFEQGSGHQVTQFGGDRTHFVVLEDVDGKTVTIDYGGLATAFDEVAPEAQELVDSVQWGGS
jgi:hypothetical protein